MLSVAFSPSGTLIASGSDDGEIILWNARTTQQIQSPLQGKSGWVKSLKFSPDGQLLLAGYGNGDMLLWNVTSRQFKRFRGDGKRIESVAFSPSGMILISGSSGDDGNLHLWPASNEVVLRLALEGHTKRVNSVQFSPDSSTIISGSADRSLRRWSAVTGKPIGSPFHVDAEVVAVAFSPDGRRLISATADDVIQIWDATYATLFRRACQRLRRHQLLLHPETFQVDNDFIAIARRVRAICTNPPVLPPLTAPANPTPASKDFNQSSLRLPAVLKFLVQTIQDVKRLLPV